LIIVANKWDLIEERDTQVYSQQIYRHIPFAQFAPIQFISAKTHEKVHKILDLIIKIDQHRHLEIPADQLAAFADWCVARHKPTKGKGNRYPKLKRFTQTGSNPPEFAVKIGAKEYLADSYLNFLVNRLRERYDLEGTPVKIWVEKANAVHGKADQ
jgi:GTP-binding protein